MQVRKGLSTMPSPKVMAEDLDGWRRIWIDPRSSWEVLLVMSTDDRVRKNQGRRVGWFIDEQTIRSLPRTDRSLKRNISVGMVIFP